MTKSELTHEQVRRDADAIFDWTRAIRRTLHRRPELGFQEFETAATIRAVLDSLGIPYRHGIAGTGIVATLGTGSGPCVALRADMDALPITEDSGVPFASEIPGRMHACGHDCHTAMLLGAARLLKQHEAHLAGTVRLVFQPAEELGQGAVRMINEGALDGVPIERMLGLHIWPPLATGTIASRAGAFLAGCGEPLIEIEGVGGHAALPHRAVDPVVTAAKIIVEAQTLVSREVDPMTPAVVSITTVHGGEATNVIPPRVNLTGTIRALSNDVLAHLAGRLEAMARDVALANRCQARMTLANGLQPATVNDERVWRLVQVFARGMVPADQVIEIPPIMGSEDFAAYGASAPSCFVFLGCGGADGGAAYGVHHPKMIVDERVLPIGVALHALFAMEALGAVAGEERSRALPPT